MLTGYVGACCCMVWVQVVLRLVPLKLTCVVAVAALKSGMCREKEEKKNKKYGGAKNANYGHSTGSAVQIARGTSKS